MIDRALHASRGKNDQVRVANSSKLAGCRYCCRSTGQTDGGTANARLLHIRAYNNNNNNNNNDYVYDAIIMTKVIARVHRVHLMNVD